MIDGFHPEVMEVLTEIVSGFIQTYGAPRVIKSCIVHKGLNGLVNDELQTRGLIPRGIKRLPEIVVEQLMEKENYFLYRKPHGLSEYVLCPKSER